MVKKAIGAPPKYDREKCCAEILSTLAEGNALRSICARDGMPSIGTFFGWVASDSILADQYARARAICLDVMADEIIVIADTPEIGQKSVSKATGLEITEGDMTEHRRLRIEARKWLLGKMAPKKYGEKLELSTDPDRPIAFAVVERVIVDPIK